MTGDVDLESLAVIQRASAAVTGSNVGISTSKSRSSFWRTSSADCGHVGCSVDSVF